MERFHFNMLKCSTTGIYDSNLIKMADGVIQNGLNAKVYKIIN